MQNLIRWFQLSTFIQNKATLLTHNALGQINVLRMTVRNTSPGYLLIANRNWASKSGQRFLFVDKD
jgi:hypothetical protein